MSTTYGRFTDGTARCVSRGGYDEQRGGEASITDEWAVTLPAGTRPVASQITDLPKLGDAAGGTGTGVLAQMVVSSISWRQSGENSLLWIATVKYTPGSKTASSSTTQATYYNKRWGFRTVAADLVQDAVDGRAVVNSAGEPFDSVPQRDMFLPVVSFSMLSSIAPASIIAFNGTVNDAAVTVLGVAFAKHCARISIECRNLDPEEVDSSRKYEYQITVEGASTPYSATAPKSGAAPSSVTDIGWDVSALSAGYCQRGANGLEPVFIEDADGNPARPQSPVPLDASGAYAPTDPDLHFLRFAAYPEATWPDYLTPSA